MKKRILSLFLFVLLTLCLVPILFCHLWLETDFGCFGTLFPSRSQIEERTHVKFPPSMANLHWRCHPSLDADAVILRFTIASQDLEKLTTDMSGYQPWYPGEQHLPRFFERFDDHPSSEENLERFQTWQITTPCGWTNNLADMDDPDVYTIYVVYSDIEHCELFRQLDTYYAVQATQSAIPNPTP